MRHTTRRDVTIGDVSQAHRADESLINTFQLHDATCHEEELLLTV